MFYSIHPYNMVFNDIYIQIPMIHEETLLSRYISERFIILRRQIYLHILISFSHAGSSFLTSKFSMFSFYPLISLAY